MTPEEAVTALITNGALVEVRMPAVRQLFEAVRDAETLRCAKLAEDLAASSLTMDFGCTEDITEVLREHARNILRTGGLEAEEPDAKLKL